MKKEILECLCFTKQIGEKLRHESFLRAAWGGKTTSALLMPMEWTVTDEEKGT